MQYEKKNPGDYVWQAFGALCLYLLVMELTQLPG